MQQKNSPFFVGIDLGTTNSAAAIYDGSELAVVRNGQGSVLTPSVVRLDGRGNVLVGARARRYLDTDPANTRSEFKRLMGTSNRLDFPASGAARLPEELSAEILKALRNDIADQTGVLPDRAVISVPALFELHQTAATSDAARRAGFERIELIQEPVASAIAAGWTKESAEGPWLVYDLGGGTFDVSLLDTREGLLRIVGHDGDNFLGGRDFDRALVELALQKLKQDGIVIDHADPRHAIALRRLRFAAEEAKIELTRAGQAPIFVPGLDIDGTSFDVDVSVTRTEYEGLIAPLIDRSLQICRRLMTANGIPTGGLQRLVLVGGPTITPLLRAMVRDALAADLGEGLDPMTLVAQGAALFACTVGLEGRPTAAQSKPDRANSRGVWLQFPAMTADLTPFVVGKVLEQADPIKAVRVERADGQWQSEPTACQADGTFAIMVSLLARQSSVFRLSGVLANGGHVDLQPSEFRISHGLTIGEPPLARSIGVALADNQVMRYFECGAALPIRRTFTLRTVETVHPQDTSYALKVPIVQGEFSLAHLCRLVGTLEIPGSSLNAALPVGSEIELMLELDRGGQLRARGRIVCTDQIFDQVAVLITPQISLDEAEAALERLVERAESLSRTAFRDRSSADANRLSGIFSRFEEIRQNLSAVRGSDFDAGEQVRRALTEVDGILADAEAEKAWPELMENLEGEFPGYLAWVAQYGGDQEMSSLTRAYHACRQAIADKQEQEAERQFSVIRQIGSGAYLRSPGAWAQQFDKAAARADESTDLRRAAELVSRGKVARQQNNQFELEKIVQELWGLQPVESQTRVLGHGSGLITL